MPSPDIEQAALDRLSMTLADMGHDERMVAIVNAIVYSNSHPTMVISSLAQLMVTLAALIDDVEVKERCVKSLHDAADLFADAVMRQDPKRMN